MADEELIKIVNGWAFVPIGPFRGATRDLAFDVYLKLSDENYAHVFSRTSGLDYKRLAHYMSKGMTHFCVKSEDLQAYRDFVSRPALAVFQDPDTPQEKKIATLLNMTEQNMAELFTQVTVQEETARSAQKLISSYVELMATSPNTLAIILKLVSHGEYLYYHSIAVSIFSMFVAKASGQFNQKMLENIALGGFLHDIGCTQLPDQVVNSPTDLTKDQWDLMHQHPRIGMKMLEGNKIIPDEVRFIVYQHHENPNGEGYPNGLRGAAIYLPARIVALADAFSALISKRPFRPAFQVDQALRILGEDPGKFDPMLVNVLSTVLLRQTDSKNTKKAA